MNLKEVIRECLKSNPKAQKELYDKYSKGIMHACERFFKDKNQVNEAFQQSIITIFNKLDQFDPLKGEFGSWSYKIAINHSLEIIRKDKKLIFNEPVNDLLEDNVYIVDSDLEYKDLKNLIDDLPEGQKYVFNLYAIEGYKHQEIAELLNISVGTSKSQLNKARTNLKKSYHRNFA